MSFPTPTWPLLNKDGSVKCDRAKLEAHYAPWAELAKKGDRRALRRGRLLQ